MAPLNVIILTTLDSLLSVIVRFRSKMAEPFLDTDSPLEQDRLGGCAGGLMHMLEQLRISKEMKLIQSVYIPYIGSGDLNCVSRYVSGTRHYLMNESSVMVPLVPWFVKLLDYTVQRETSATNCNHL